MNGSRDRLESLLAELFDESLAEEAQLDIQAEYGVTAVPRVLELLPSLGAFGKLCAIDIIQDCDLRQLQAIREPSVVTVLLSELKNTTPVVREWVAETLGWLGDQEAVPALIQARRAADKARVPMDWTEQSTLRRALVQLGARAPVIPAITASLMESNSSFDRCWPASVFEEIVVDLAAAGQVLLYSQVWVRDLVTDTFHWESWPGYELDLALPWPELVRQSRDAALAAATKLKTRKNRVITPEWVDESDRQ